MLGGVEPGGQHRGPDMQSAGAVRAGGYGGRGGAQEIGCFFGPRDATRAEVEHVGDAAAEKGVREGGGAAAGVACLGEGGGEMGGREGGFREIRV